LGILVAWIIAGILREDGAKARSRWSGRVVMVTLIYAGIVVDFLSFSHQSTPVICPPSYSALSGTPVSAGILNLPMTYEAGNRFMMYQLCLERPIVHASISRKLNKTLSDRLSALDASDKKEALKRAGVRHVVIHLPLLTSDPSFDLSEYVKNYRLVFQDRTEMVFVVD
jgi:plasmid maintenance system killer protein